jgi:hypothetical protein
MGEKFRLFTHANPTMRTKIIVPAVIIVGLLLSVFIRPGPQLHEVPDRITPQPGPKPQTVIPTRPVSPTVTPVKSMVIETPTELVLAKLRAWDDDDQPDMREQRVRELATLLDGTNAWDIIAGVPANLMGYVFAVPSVRERMMSDPAAVLDWMSKHPNVQSQLQTFLQDWSQSDKNAMQQTISTLPESPWREQVVAAAANQALTTDPASAVGLAMQMEVTPQQNPWLDMAMTEWAKQDPYAAAQIANKVGDLNLQQQLFADVTVGLAGSNPQAASEFAQQFITDGKTLNDSMGAIAWAWALQDPASAGTWLAQLPDGDAQQNALINLIQVWGNHDPNAATTWVENLPEGPLQTRAASVLLPVVSGPK